MLSIENLQIILLVGCSICTLASGADSGSHLKVLIVNGNEKQQIIEEAAALSLDTQPNNPRDRGPEFNGTGSLVLQQSLNPETSERQRRLPRHQYPWSEINLPRLKPSWLNVSSRFKITGNKIEEAQFMYPTEYLLRSAFDSPILLQTKLGILEGVRSIQFNKHLYTFLSVPYAKAPVGNLRFKAPEPIEGWNGIQQATKWPPFCIQPSMTLASKSSPVHILTQIMSEDCLYLNIWTPSLKMNKDKRRPVMVWLHGGAFQYGGISVDENDASALALIGDVVVVTLNYRISVFGFLNANNQLNAPNNVGILDQRAALEWVQANIKQFGGDPQQVTLFGESAGGHSVGLHMISPKSQPLFKRAIMQSGVPTSFLRSYDVNSDNKGSMHSDGISGIMLAKRLGCYSEPNATESVEDSISDTKSEVDEAGDSTSDTDASNDTMATGFMDPILDDSTIDCLRQKSSLDLLRALGAPGNSGFFPTGNDQQGVFPNGPIMESFDPEDPKIGPQKDYLLGINSDEGTFMLHYGMPKIFPSKLLPKVTSLESFKKSVSEQLEEMSKATVFKLNGSDLLNNHSGSHSGGAQAHLYRPLLRTSTTMLENLMIRSPKSGENLTASLGVEGQFGRALGGLITDIIFLCPARSLAKTLNENGRNVYFYVFTHRPSNSQYHEWLGVTHHDEVEFVFGRPLRLADAYSGADIEMSKRMIKTWSHFAYTGQMLDQLGVRWPTYGNEDNNYMVMAHDHASIGQRYHDKVCNMYETVISVHLQDA